MTKSISQLAVQLSQPEQLVIDQVNRMNRNRKKKIKNDAIEQKDGVVIGLILTMGYTMSRARELQKLVAKRKKHLQY